MTAQANGSVFPLPLVPFERYMLADDRPAYPMAFPIQLEFTGVFDRGQLEAAAVESVARHPLLGSLVHRGWAGRPFWQVARDQAPAIDWGERGEPLRFASGEAVDLKREVGLRLWVRQGGGRATLTAQFHHACCDGLGALRFLGDVLAGYANRVASAGPTAEPEPVEAGALRDRADFQSDVPLPVGPARALWTTVREGGRWALRRVTPLAAEPEAARRAGPEPDYPGIEAESLDAAEHDALRSVASRRGVTVNDLLLRDLFLTLGQWNAERGSGRPGDWLQVNMPVNLRQRLRDSLPAANKMSYTFLARRPAQLADPDALLEGIRAETAAIKQWGLGVLFQAGLRWAGHVPGLMPLVAARTGCCATAVLTNLGELSRRLGARFPRQDGRLVAGDVVLDDCRLVAPLRPLTRAAFAVASYRGRLILNARCDPRCFTPAAARELLGRFADRVRATADANTPTGEPAAHLGPGAARVSSSRFT